MSLIAPNTWRTASENEGENILNLGATSEYPATHLHVIE